MSDLASRVCLNIGSGQRPFKSVPGWEWINIDINPKWEPDIIADGANLPMIPSESVDRVVMHHVLEHYGCGEAIGVIREAHRVLKPGGYLSVFVPDMRALVQGWIAGRIDDQVFMTNVYGAYMDDEADRHKFGYTFKSLDTFLKQVPWDATCGAEWDTPGSWIARDWWILGWGAIK